MYNITQVTEKLLRVLLLIGAEFRNQKLDQRQQREGSHQRVLAAPYDPENVVQLEAQTALAELWFLLCGLLEAVDSFLVRMRGQKTRKTGKEKRDKQRKLNAQFKANTIDTHKVELQYLSPQFLLLVDDLRFRR